MEKEEAAGLDLAGSPLYFTLVSTLVLSLPSLPGACRTKVETKVNYNGTFLMSPHAQRLAEMSRDSTRVSVIPLSLDPNPTSSGGMHRATALNTGNWRN